jgi:NADP-dependent 3-hydroxy acid dehydrogenase YdfG
VVKTLKDQITLVTGASGAIGGSIAAALAQQGASLCIASRDKVNLNNVAVRLRAATGRVDICPTDLTSETDIESLAEYVKKEFGRLDVLVHCAGAIDHGKLEDAPMESLDRQYSANVRGPLLLTKRLLPLLKKPRGQVVFINSSAGLTGRANTGHYSATKHACKALADTLRDEVNPDGVRVLSVFPGRTAGPRIQDLHAKEGRPYQPELLLQPEDIASVVLNALTLPWTAEVTNISIRPMQKSY